MKNGSILNPDEKEIEKFVMMYENEYWFVNKLLYIGCIKEIEKINICKIQEKDIKGPIRTFLINWGMMSRVLGRKERENWEERLLEQLEKLGNKFEEFRKLKLESVELENYKEDIKECYQKINKIIGPTSTSKVLHLICPEFFPLWDENIRKLVSKECKNCRIGNSGEGYYKFMREIKEFLRKYEEPLSKLVSKLSKEYNYDKLKLKIVDEYMWIRSRNQDCKNQEGLKVSNNE